ncbi:GNAT family N-acetyltransferase [Streptomyces sp. NPDC058052]|uniref:GNAT family N-acetyltransferase n=1 Tax=Streptomyces sp. NPDC058052 TaxID=3346316 RepID=UPI0036E05A90
MDLLPFTPGHAAAVAGWATSPTEALHWCGHRGHPVPPETVTDWRTDPDSRAYVLTDGPDLLGYGEVWHDAEEHEAELARIVVAPGTRGRGLGRVLTLRLLAEALAAGFTDVFLRVHPDNAVALRCYEGAGFVRVDAETAQEWNAAQPVAYIWLRHETPA